MPGNVYKNGQKMLKSRQLKVTAPDNIGAVTLILILTIFFGL